MESKRCAQDFIAVNIACWLRKSFALVALDINKMWPVCCCYISFEKPAWWWSLAIDVFVSFGFERTKMWLCLWRELGSWKNTLKKEDFQFFTFIPWLMLALLKVSKSSNGVILISVVLLESWQRMTQNRWNLLI